MHSKACDYLKTSVLALIVLPEIHADSKVTLGSNPNLF